MREYEGELLKDEKPDGKLLKKEHKGDLIKTESQKGRPLWKDTKLNEEKKKKKKLNEAIKSVFMDINSLTDSEFDAEMEKSKKDNLRIDKFFNSCYYID